MLPSKRESMFLEMPVPAVVLRDQVARLLDESASPSRYTSSQDTSEPRAKDSRGANSILGKCHGYSSVGPQRSQVLGRR